MKKILFTAFLCLNFASAFAVTKPFFLFDDGAINFPKAEFLNEFTARIPFKLVDNLIIVEAELLSQKGDFIIDTGSKTLILNENHFPNKYSFSSAKTASGVMDVIENVRERTLQEFLLHDFKLENTTSEIIDLSHIEKTKKIHLLGIIGYSILKDYEVFVDLYLNQITLSKVNKFGEKLDKLVYSEKIVDSIPFKLRGHTIVLNAEVNGENLNFGLDTAAEFNQINKSVKQKVLNYFIPKKRVLLSGASDRQIEVLSGKMFGIKLSETVYFGPMNTVLTNLHQMNEAFGTKLDGVLGFEFFQQKRTIINYQKEQLYFIDYPLQKFEK